MKKLVTSQQLSQGYITINSRTGWIERQKYTGARLVSPDGATEVYEVDDPIEETERLNGRKGGE